MTYLYYLNLYCTTLFKKMGTKIPNINFVLVFLIRILSKLIIIKDKSDILLDIKKFPN